MIAYLTDPDVVAKILAHLGLASSAPPRGPPTRAEQQTHFDLVDPQAPDDLDPPNRS